MKEVCLKYLIMNADDFGYTRGVNQGIIEAHLHGMVLSTSLMVNMSLSAEAVALDAINSDYSAHIHTAREIAAEYFSAEKVLSQLLHDAGL
jgi:predicted glycoside hydrolase/deacetylase ChbG (UPF0249 family)